MNKSLIFPNLEESPCITGSDNCSCIEMIWQTGHYIDKNQYDLSRLEFICETLPLGHFTEFAVTDLGCPIVSDQLKNILDTAGVNNVEYFPATIIEKTDTLPLTNYYAINILGLVNCIDFEQSDLEVEEEDGEIVDIDEVNQLILNDRSYGHIYRLFMFERVIVIEEALEEKLSAILISGMNIVKPENWDGFAGEK